VARSNNDEVIGAYETQRDANLKKKLDEAKLQWTEVYDLAKKGGISKPVEPQGAREPRSRIPGRIHSVAPRRSSKGPTHHDAAIDSPGDSPGDPIIEDPRPRSRVPGPMTRLAVRRHRAVRRRVLRWQ